MAFFATFYLFRRLAFFFVFFFAPGTGLGPVFFTLYAGTPFNFMRMNFGADEMR